MYIQQIGYYIDSIFPQFKQKCLNGEKFSTKKLVEFVSSSLDAIKRGEDNLNMVHIKWQVIEKFKQIYYDYINADSWELQLFVSNNNKKLANNICEVKNLPKNIYTEVYVCKVPHKKVIGWAVCIGVSSELTIDFKNKIEIHPAPNAVFVTDIVYGDKNESSVKLLEQIKKYL